MLRKDTFRAMVLICLLLAIFEAKFGSLVTAIPGVIRVPADKPTIQQAIESAKPGDIIRVASGTYHEHLIVNKRISLLGESSATTIIDGDENGTVVTISTSDVMINGFMIQHAGGWPYSGVLLFSLNNSVISNNKIVENEYCGLEIKAPSSHNIIEGNIIANNKNVGCLVNSQNNDFYRNSFINNTHHVLVYAPTSWDNGAEGNYWSDYNGTDADGDGIGDTAYSGDVQDKYPLIEPWTLTRVFPVGFHNISVQSDSTVALFSFNGTSKEIGFRMTGPSGASFFCDVVVPKALLNASTSERWLVLLNGTEVYTEVDIEEDYTLLHFSRHFSKLEVRILVVSAEGGGGLDFTVYVLGFGIAILMVAMMIFVMKKKKTLEKQIKTKSLKAGKTSLLRFRNKSLATF
jgi:hypothetical protein